MVIRETVEGTREKGEKERDVHKKGLKSQVGACVKSGQDKRS